MTQSGVMDLVPFCRQERPGSIISLSKYQTLGNSYLIFDPVKNGFGDAPFEPARNWIKKVCNQDYGIGSNGLLVGPDRRSSGVFEFRIFNSDGSQAQLSGNGARIFARYLLDANYVLPDQSSKFSIAAVSRELDRVAIEVIAEALTSSITTTISTTPSFGAAAVGAFGSVTFGGSNSSTISALVDIGNRNGQGGGFWSDSTLLSIGNPHCVTFLRSYEMLPSVSVLRQLRSEFSLIADAPLPGASNSTFRDGCNLQWCFVEDRHHIHLRIVERGEGPTLASGSSAAAAFIAAFARGLVGHRATVIMPGGKLNLVLSLCDNEIANVKISGEANFIAEIRMV
jgi:diaminopimelate epimerase